jgi:hypothetical protein
MTLKTLEESILTVLSFEMTVPAVASASLRNVESLKKENKKITGLDLITSVSSRRLQYLYDQVS